MPKAVREWWHQHELVCKLPASARAELRRQLALRRCLDRMHVLGLLLPRPVDARVLRATEAGRSYLGLERDVQVSGGSVVMCTVHGV